MTVVLTPGCTFAGYRIESLVARGGMGVVYRATDLSLERPVALKLIAPELAEDTRFRARFLKEQRLAASLDHPAVVPIYEAGERDGQLYLAMRYVHGSDLKTVLHRGGTLAVERSLAILAQIADALDAAHRRGLVHRDVKPGNVLIDQDGHAYLTDFGITKRLGAASTDTGRVLGTLDYLAPEQIRGEPVDARTDCYALACVLYECFAGTPPFRRQTEAETLWAHLQEPPPPLRGQPALDAILQRALAKERDERYGSCGELIAAARAALGLAARAPIRRPRVQLALHSHSRAILVAGLLVLAGAIAAGIVALTMGGEASDLGTIGNGIAAIDPVKGNVTRFIESATAPSNIAVGEGAVWVLNTQDQTISRIDPKTKAVTRRLPTRGVLTDIAAGEGAVWVGNGAGHYVNYTVSISRIDPETGAITRTVKLPNKTAGSIFQPTPNWGIPNIAFAAGSVWASNPDGTVSRLDPATGKLLATIDVQADKLAAGREGVWFVNGSAVTRIDPRTNRAGQTIHIGSEGTTAIAAGAGSIWVTAEQQGAAWRIEPGPDPETRSIDVGVGVTYVAFGAGAVWAANYVDGTVSRIDPRTNAVTAKTPIGAAQALAAGAGTAWVSTAGSTQTNALPDSVCSEAMSGGREPDVMIVSDLPLQGPGGAGARAAADAIGFVLRRHDFRAGRFAVGYRSCDDSTAQTGSFENRRCAANANAYAHAERLVAVIGPYHSPCAAVQIPILNRAPGGPLAMISPSTTWPGLTRSGPWAQLRYRGEPDVYYPTGVRNYFRLRPRDDLQSAADAVLAKRLGLGSVYLLDDGPGDWRALVSDPFRHVAQRLGVRIAGSATFDPAAKSYDALASRVARSGAQGVVIGGDPFNGGDRLLKALRARLGAQVPIMGGYLFAFAPDVLKRAGRAARGMYATTLDLPTTALPLTATGRAFARDVGAFTAPTQGVLEAGQAAELLMAAIARSDGTRASVLHRLRASEVKDGILGSFRFDANGDITTASIPILRITGATPPGSGFPPDFQGATLDRVVQMPTNLAD